MQSCWKVVDIRQKFVIVYSLEVNAGFHRSFTEVIFFAKNIILVFICVPPSHYSEKIISDFLKSMCIIIVKEGKYSLE